MAAKPGRGGSRARSLPAFFRGSRPQRGLRAIGADRAERSLRTVRRRRLRTGRRLIGAGPLRTPRAIRRRGGLWARRERNLGNSVYDRLADFDWNSPVGEAKACGGDAMMRVEAFRQLSGFNPSLIAGQKPELCIRLRR